MAQIPWFESLAAYHEVADAAPALSDLASRREPQVGDEVTYELTLDQSARSRRWTLRFVVVEVEPLDSAQPVPSSQGVDRDGESARFSTARTWMDIYVTDDDPARPARVTRDSIRTDHLVTGLFFAAEVLERVLRAMAGHEEAEIDGEVFGNALGSFMAVMEVLQDNDELAPILWEVIEKPSVWSVVTQGVRLGLSMDVAKPWTTGIPEAAGPAFRLPVSLSVNDQPALRVSALVVESRAPITTGAGILSLVAERPDGSGTRARMRLIGARRAAPAANSTPPR